jgi:hypothetical protein
MSCQNRLCLGAASVALASFIGGHATLTLSATSETDAGELPRVAQNKANFYLYRDPNIRVVVTTKLAANGKEVDATKHNSCGHWVVDPGTYDISSESASASTVHIVAQAGKSYYVWQDVKVSAMGLPTNELHVVDADTGRRGLSKCTKVLEASPAKTP